MHSEKTNMDIFSIIQSQSHLVLKDLKDNLAVFSVTRNSVYPLTYALKEQKDKHFKIIVELFLSQKINADWGISQALFEAIRIQDRDAVRMLVKFEAILQHRPSKYELLDHTVNQFSENEPIFKDIFRVLLPDAESKRSFNPISLINKHLIPKHFWNTTHDLLLHNQQLYKEVTSWSDDMLSLFIATINNKNIPAANEIYNALVLSMRKHSSPLVASSELLKASVHDISLLSVVSEMLMRLKTLDEERDEFGRRLSKEYGPQRISSEECISFQYKLDISSLSLTERNFSVLSKNLLILLNCYNDSKTMAPEQVLHMLSLLSTLTKSIYWNLFFRKSLTLENGRLTGSNEEREKIYNLHQNNIQGVFVFLMNCLSQYAQQREIVQSTMDVLTHLYKTTVKIASPSYAERGSAYVWYKENTVEHKKINMSSWSMRGVDTWDTQTSTCLNCVSNLSSKVTANNIENEVFQWLHRLIDAKESMPVAKVNLENLLQIVLRSFLCEKRFQLMMKKTPSHHQSEHNSNNTTQGAHKLHANKHVQDKAPVIAATPCDTTQRVILEDKSFIEKCVHMHFWKLIELILENECLRSGELSPNETALNRMVLDCAARENQVAVIQLLIKTQPLLPCYQSQLFPIVDENNPLHVAILNNHEEAMLILVKSITCVVGKNAHQETPAILAAKKENIQALRMILLHHSPLVEVEEEEEEEEEEDEYGYIAAAQIVGLRNVTRLKEAYEYLLDKTAPSAEKASSALSCYSTFQRGPTAGPAASVENTSRLSA